MRRLLLQYVVIEINAGSLCALTGLPLFVFGLMATLRTAWADGAPPSSIGLAALLLGAELLLGTLFYDVQFSTPTRKLKRERADTAAVRSRRSTR